MQNTLYIHTKKYTAHVSKTDFLRLVEYKYKYLMCQNGIESKKLYSIYCYNDGFVRFSILQDNYSAGKVVVEQYLPDFATIIDMILEKSFLRKKIS